MARVRSKKYAGVYLNELANGDISYSITYKNLHGRKTWFNVGKKSEGITEILANNIRIGFKHKINLDEDPIAHKKKKQITTLNDLSTVYFDDNTDNKTNDRQEGKYDLHIKPILGDKDIHSITKDDILKLQRSLKTSDKAPKTVNGSITLLKAIINYSIKEKDLKLINPCVGVKPLKEDDRRERYLDLDEVNQLIDAVQGDKVQYYFVKMALTTGARLESVLHIQKKDINLSGNTITITDLKSGGTYKGYYDDEYKAEIESYIKQLKVNDYFIGGNAKPVPGRTMRRWLKPTLDKLFNKGLDIRDAKNRVVIHTLRHTFASHLATAGVPILTIKELMHHADIKHTMRYAKLAPDQGRDAVKGLYK